MKKGTKLSDTQYFLEIKDLQYNSLYLAAAISLREAVRLASEYVSNMDNYSKVYRELKAMSGAFIGVYFTSAKVDKKPRHAFVLIHSSAPLTPEQERNTIRQIAEMQSIVEFDEFEDKNNLNK